MTMKKYLLGTILLGLLFVISGCASYGKLTYVRPSAEAVTIQELKDRWQEYEIYYSGRMDDPSAVLFDQKNDGRTLMVSDRWRRVEDKAMLTGLVIALQNQPAETYNYARMWKVLGPDDFMYGYMLTGWEHAVMKVVDEETMLAYDMPLPPYRAFIEKRGFKIVR